MTGRVRLPTVRHRFLIDLPIMKEVLVKLRPLMPFGICALAATSLAYLLTRPLDYTTAFLLMVMAFLLTFPLLLRFSYPFLMLTLLMPGSLFFLKGSPPLWMLVMVFCLGITVVERAITGKSRILFVPQIVLPLLMLGFVVFMTAELTGGMGFRSLGSEVFGGKKYAFTFAGILVFFAITSRPIPADKVRLYTALFLLGNLPGCVADLAAIMPGSLNFIYLFIAPGEAGADELGNYSDLEVGVSRMGGCAAAALAVFLWLLARHGVRGIFRIRQPWRMLGLGAAVVVIALGGYRSAIMQAMMIFGFLFFLERLHRTPLLFVFLLGGILLGGAAMPFASRLPFVIQRSLAFLPLTLNPEAVASAQASSTWRMDMWTALLPEIPKHLLLGKGLALPAETFNEMTTAVIAVNGQIDSSQQSLALSGDYHNGPLSVVLPFGIWGVLAFGWFMWAAVWVLYRNYKFGDPVNLTVNRFLFGFFLVKIVIFSTVFGSLSTDLYVFTSYVGFSIAINHGVCRERSAAQSAAGELSQVIRYKRALPAPAPAPWSSAHLS